MFSVDTFKSKFQPVKRESADVRDWTKRNAYLAMDSYLKDAERISINGSSIQSWKSLNSLLSGSLLSSDVPSKENVECPAKSLPCFKLHSSVQSNGLEELDISSTRTPYYSNKSLIYKTDGEHIQEIMELLSIKKCLLCDPVLKEVLQKCENTLRETKVKMPLGSPELEPSHIDDFEVVRTDQIFQESSAILHEAQTKTHKGGAILWPKFFLSNFLKNLAESRRYRKLSRNGSYSSGDLRTLGQQANISKCFEAKNGPVISSALDCPTYNQFNQKPSCAVLGVLNVCEHCNQPLEELLIDDQFSTPPCIICQESFPRSEMECHLKKHSSIEELDRVK